MGLTIQGDRKLRGALEALPRRVRRTALNKALGKGAIVVRKAAREEAPIDKKKLRKSIKIKKLNSCP